MEPPIFNEKNGSKHDTAVLTSMTQMQMELAGSGHLELQSMVEMYQLCQVYIAMELAVVLAIRLDAPTTTIVQKMGSQLQ